MAWKAPGPRGYCGCDVNVGSSVLAVDLIVHTVVWGLCYTSAQICSIREREDPNIQCKPCRDIRDTQSMEDSITYDSWGIT
jgi:hypothetical protein